MPRHIRYKTSNNKLQSIKVMKKILVLLLICISSTAALAQDYKDSDYYYYDGVENYKGFTISSEQKSKIISIKKSIGKRHAAIGRDSSIRGAAKGAAHRKLNQQIRKEIDDILDASQRNKWEDYRTSNNLWKNKWEKNDRIERRKDAIEDKIDDLEDYYDDLIDAVEDDTRLSKSERKARKNALKQELKIKKKELERQKDLLDR